MAPLRALAMTLGSSTYRACNRLTGADRGRESALLTTGPRTIPKVSRESAGMDRHAMGTDRQDRQAPTDSVVRTIRRYRATIRPVTESHT